MNGRIARLFLVGAISWGAAAGLACGSGGGFNGFNGPDGSADGRSTTDSMRLPSDDAGKLHSGDGSATGALTIKPQNPTLTVTVPGAAGTQLFQAFLNGTPGVAAWSIDNPSIGTINNGGNFVASGTAGGTTVVTAQAGSAKATTTLTVNLDITANTGMVPASVQTQLKAGGPADPTFVWLYPYNNTIFPRGLTGPVLQFGGTAPDDVYVHITATGLNYQAFFGASTPAAVTLAATDWTTISETAGGNNALTVAVTKISGGVVSGPITQTWTIAEGSLKGTVYYNSYDSALGGGMGTILKMKPGTPASVLVGGSAGCMVCHAVSSDGSTLTASNADYTSGQSYSLAPAGATAVVAQPNADFSFAGLYSDGTLALTNPAMAGSWPPNVPGTGSIEGGQRVSQLVNPKTGAVIAAPGFDGVVTNALMPTFSPDGKKVVFNHYDTGMGHSIAVMDFDFATKTFSGLTDVTTDAAHYLGWPAFLPDSAEFVYHADSGADFATWQMDTANIEMVDLATKTVTPLNALNGLLASGTVYLPYGSSDINMNYEPTVLPVAVGGYYWVVFTSRREYGNTITAPDPWQTGPAIRKKLWVAAIDLNPMPGKDPSHPAFYINDQELEAGNMRGFWTLDPCEANGLGCASGDQCCTGFCRTGTSDGGTALVCVPPPTSGCAQEYEKCTTTADCCGASQGYQCINGYCAQPPPP
jgi:hypothetical protein